MEQHPVPQNVTTFQFRLIGDMTLKQFGCLVGGAIVAYIMYKLPLPFFFTWPLAVLSAVGGFGLAFVPIEERPMDVWVLSFFKSIYSPTQYVWKKQAVPETTHTATSLPKPAAIPTRRGDILQNIFIPASPAGGPSPETGTVVVSRPRKSMFDWLFDLWAPKPKAMPDRTMDFSLPPIVKPTASITQALKDTQQKESVLEDKLKKLTSELEGKTAAESRIVELQNQLTELLSEREKTNQELVKLRQQPATTRPPTPDPPAGGDGGQATTTQTPKNPTIQIIQPGRAVKVGLPRLTTFPNIVTGIVKDKDKNLLPGVLVTVKDKDGIPLRALKTNRLGQFAASTQLPNGTYLVEIEDPRLRYTFDRAQITLNGTIVPALEIFAKTEKEITRAKLEKELFGNQI
ncbi:MAG: PrgI family protein [Candidatus Gottesmanbacteria bacterium]|nr:PrgI family protein [Candidatus Gottesmanbacteria bacterium]